MQSVAFPALGAGILQYPSAAVARIMSEEANTYLKSSSGGLKEVKFVIFMDDTFQEFQKILGQDSTSNSSDGGLMEVSTSSTTRLPHPSPRKRSKGQFSK